MQKEVEYFYSTRKYFIAAAAVFIISFLAGILISEKYPDASGNVLKLLKDAFGGITALDPLEMLIEIFKNNIRNSFAALLLGLAFGIVPFTFAVLNGIVLGVIVDFFVKTKGALFVLAAILPHGIIELPAVLMSVGIGFRLGHAAYLSLMRLKTACELMNELRQAIIFYVKIIAPLLLLAALIESNVTPLIVSRFVS